MCNKKRIIVIFVSFVFFIYATSSPYYPTYMPNMFGGSGRWQSRMAKLEYFENVINKLNLAVIEKRRKIGEAGTSSDEKNILQNEVDRITEKREKMESFYRNFLLSESDSSENGMGLLIAKGIAGKDYFAMLEDTEVKGLGDGIKKGLCIQLCGALSEVVRDKAKSTVSQSIGNLWEYSLSKLSSLGNFLQNMLFHGSNKPFDFQKLDGWEKIILVVFDDINNMLCSGLRDSTRGLDSISRQFNDEGVEEQSKKDIDPWASLTKGYAEQFDFFIKLFDIHKEYYEGDDTVIFYVDQICQILEVVRKLLLSSKSLKDLDSKLDSQKTVIPAFKKIIFNLLEQLKIEIGKSHPRNDNVQNTASSYYNKPPNYSGSYGSSNPVYGNYGYGGNDPMFPQSYNMYSGF